MTYIYTLADNQGNIRYIGQTTNISQRYSAHCSRSKIVKNTHKNNWIKQLLKQGLKPELEVIDFVDDTTANDAEIYWISQLKCWGFKLTNVTEGGQFDVSNRKGCKLTKSHKLKISQSTKGISKSDSFKKKISGDKNHFYGKHHSVESKKKISEAAKNNMTEKRKKQISKSVKKAMSRPDVKEKVSKGLSKVMAGEGNPMYGKKGKDNPNFGRKNSEATKEKMRMAALKRWAKNN